MIYNNLNHTKEIPIFSEKNSLRTLLGALWGHLNPERRHQVRLLILLMLVSSFAEMISLAAVLPFLAVLANPEGLWKQKIIQEWADIFGISGPQELLLPITIGFAFTAVLAAAIRLLNLKLTGKLAAALGSDISCEAYRRTMYQSYAVHISRNSSTLISYLTSDLERTIGLVLIPALNLLSALLIVLGLIITLLIINLAIALGAGLLIAIVYSIAVLISKTPLLRLGKELVTLNKQLIKALQESLGAIREVLLDGSQEFYTSLYIQSDRPLRSAAAKSSFLTAFPRLAMEPVGMVIIALTGYALVIQGGVAKALPFLGALALGAQRLLPMVQKVYEGWAQIRNNKVNLANILNLLSQPLPVNATSSKTHSYQFTKSIQLKRVKFSYGKKLSEVIKGIDLEIFKGERIGLIGVTGSGKSTLVDILMGLLAPTSGEICIDGININSRNNSDLLKAWRASIAHVPQTIYLADSSITQNIAFGIPQEKIDMDQVKKAAEMAKISNFINQCPEGYFTHVGERGICLSGGQRQRVAIARALYKQAKLIVFDEATSALDRQTESEVMQSIDNLSSELTVIIIAHRESTLKGCDRIIKLANGVAEYE